LHPKQRKEPVAADSATIQRIESLQRRNEELQTKIDSFADQRGKSRQIMILAIDAVAINNNPRKSLATRLSGIILNYTL